MTSRALSKNKHLKVINEWAFQWKMTFNTDPNKQAQEVIFTRKYLILNNTKVSQNTTQKH